ncbi:UNVERIFIED_CONTAM: hypothetical protein Sangu_1645900 [Sesamum angustifolium]|uniref:Uncharacterized protein n=1 Tax=Sesamum angustifolium TaxID=2727405 RepID=A0AAW2MHK2_9LAMI
MSRSARKNQKDFPDFEREAGAPGPRARRIPNPVRDARGADAGALAEAGRRLRGGAVARVAAKYSLLLLDFFCSSQSADAEPRNISFVRTVAPWFRR